jgi:hypothetical protein
MNANTKNPRYGRRSTQIQKSQSLKYGRSRFSRECTRMNANTKSQKLAADARLSAQIKDLKTGLFQAEADPGG